MRRHRWALAALALSFAALCVVPDPASAAERLTAAQRLGAPTTGALTPAPVPVRTTERTDKANQNTTTVISGNPNGTYLFLAYDMSAVLDDGDALRVLPVIGKGGFQNVRDVLLLRGIDVCITQSNIMRYLKTTGELGRNIDDKLAYIAKLYNEELHILAGPGINELKDLAGKKVNFSDVGSGTQFSVRLIFEALGIAAQEVNMGQADGFLKVKTGEIAATVLIAGKPSGAFQSLKLEAGMKLLPVAYTEPLEADYFPAKLTHEDYPNLIPKGESVDTVAVGAVLAAYNWPKETERYKRVARFVDALFTKFAAFQKPPRHPKWREANLAAPVNGWKRFAPAQEWLDRIGTTAQGGGFAIDPAMARAQAAKAAPGDTGEQERLFQEFLKWSQTRK